MIKRIDIKTIQLHVGMEPFNNPRYSILDGYIETVKGQENQWQFKKLYTQEMMTCAKRLYNLDLKINCDILNDDTNEIRQNTDT